MTPFDQVMYFKGKHEADCEHPLCETCDLLQIAIAMVAVLRHNELEDEVSERHSEGGANR